MEAVKNVAPEGWDLLALDCLHGAGPWLRILTSHAADANNSLVGTPDENQTHLQEKLDLGLNDTLLAVVEELGAITALEQKGLSLGHIAEEFFELDDFPRVNDWRELLEL